MVHNKYPRTLCKTRWTDSAGAAVLNMYGHIRKHDTTVPYLIGLAYLATIHHASGYLGRLLDAH